MGWRGLVPIILIIGACSHVAAASGEDQTPLSLGITGSAPSDPARNPTAILRPPEMQRLILDIADRPHTRTEIETAIAGQFFSVDDMVTVGLLREDAGTYRIDFNLLRVADQEKILEVAEASGRDLAKTLLKRRGEFETIARGRDQPGDLSAEFLYIVLGCFSLDWDGLDLTRERGWRLGAQRVIDGQEFTPWAKERGTAISLQGLYWGSHNHDTGEATLTSFGDHHSLPRFALPDLLWSNSTSFSRYEGLEDEKRSAARMLAAYEHDVTVDVVRVMMELGRQAAPIEALGQRTGIDEHKLGRILSFLEAAKYIESRGDSWQATVPVLLRDDAKRVDRVVAIGREIMIEWHEANYDRVREALADLTPIKSGVPFGRVYTEIWHFIFGIANRTLVEEGLFVDPYGEGRSHQGFVPAVWETALADAP